MNKINAFLLSAICLLISNTSFAMPATTAPAVCPSAATIKQGGLAYVEYDYEDNSGYMAFQLNNYGSSNQWLFGIDAIQASSQQAAMSTAYNILATLNGYPVPTYIPSENVWVCLYSTSTGNLALAMTPLPTAAKLKRAAKSVPAK